MSIYCNSKCHNHLNGSRNTVLAAFSNVTHTPLLGYLVVVIQLTLGVCLFPENNVRNY